MKKIIIYIIILSTFTLIHPTLIKQINIIGNSKTSDHYILKKINHQINVPYDINIANDDINNLLNMEIFESVQIIVDNHIYHIIVKEKKLITYAPLIRKEEGIGWSVGPIININNINGNAKNIYFSSGLGAINSGQISYFNQKILLEYKYNTYNSIESDYTMNKNNLFISYIIKKKQYTVNVTPQVNHYILNYSNPAETKKYKYFSLSYNYLYKLSNSSQYTINFTAHRSLNNYTNYSKLFISYKHMVKKKNPLITFKTELILNSKEDIPDFENLYIGGENFVRGYYPNPIDNPQIIQDQLVFKNLIFHSLQFEIPVNIISNKIIKTNLLFFYDYGLGSNAYNNFRNNTLKGYGLGISMITINQIKFDICIGLNHFGSRTIHFIRNVN